MTTKPEESSFPIVVNGSDFTAGLTKREHFAALAMQSLIIAGAPMGQMSNSKEGVQIALQWADDLIAELNKPPTS